MECVHVTFDVIQGKTLQAWGDATPNPHVKQLIEQAAAEAFRRTTRYTDHAIQVAIRKINERLGKLARDSGLRIRVDYAERKRQSTDGPCLGCGALPPAPVDIMAPAFCARPTENACRRAKGRVPGHDFEMRPAVMFSSLGGCGWS